MSTNNKTTQSATRNRAIARSIAALFTFLVTIIVASVPFVGLTTTAAHACACGCSVFDVGGLDLPQEQDHGGRIFLEYWSGDQTQNYVGSSKAPAALNTDKEINTQWINVGFSYNFNRDWGVFVRIPTTNRTLTTDTGAYTGVVPFNTKDIGDIEIMGMYTGFFKDMSTGIMFGLKLPTGTFTAPGLDRDSQIGSGSTDFELGAFPPTSRRKGPPNRLGNSDWGTDDDAANELASMCGWLDVKQTGKIAVKNSERSQPSILSFSPHDEKRQPKNKRSNSKGGRCQFRLLKQLTQFSRPAFSQTLTCRKTSTTSGDAAPDLKHPTGLLRTNI